VTVDGKHAVTHYETIEAFPYASLLEIHLETGRTHQIRVHMAAQRHPCAGDAMYGADPTLSARLGLTRQWLHARQLSFVHPGTGEWATYGSDYPAHLQHALDALGGD
jgi:23S rRNA pseudouridine1911/1915/1917 synthase